MELQSLPKCETVIKCAPQSPPAGAFQLALPCSKGVVQDVEEDSPSHQPSESSEFQADYSYDSPTKEVHDVDFDVEEQEVKKLHQQMYKAEEGQRLDPSLLSELSRILFVNKQL